MNHRKFTIAVNLGIVTAMLILSGCASRQLRSDYDPSVDFSTYKTYNFYENAGPQGSEYRQFFDQYMVSAISKEMESRGYVKSENPDVRKHG